MNNLTDSLLSSSSSNKVDFPYMKTELNSDLNMSSSSSTLSSNSFFSFLGNISFTTWIIIILILSFLGFNIFAYLAKGTQDTTNFLAPILSKLFGTSVAVSSQVVDVSAEGAKAVVGTTSNVLESGLTAIQQATPNTVPNPIPNSQTAKSLAPIKDDKIKHEAIQETTLNKALNTAQSQTQIQTKLNEDYEADYASSSIQGGGKSGWCYIGLDRGYRTCAEVGVNDTCMSGQIFPSHEICMNPSLRP